MLRIWADLPEEYHHEPELALASGEDGLDLVGQMLKQAVAFMNEGAWLFVEVGNSEVHMAQRFPGLEVTWLEFENGGHGIFAVNRETLVQYWNTEE